jgi:hypothetical protein
MHAIPASPPSAPNSPSTPASPHDAVDVLHAEAAHTHAPMAATAPTTKATRVARSESTRSSLAEVDPGPRGGNAAGHVKSIGFAVAALALLLPLGCACNSGGALASAVRREPTLEQWALARQRLSALRATVPSDAYVARVAVAIYEPKSGRGFDGRGAVAVLPSRAMRMILVGPGGATAFDAWITTDAWRVSVPAIDLVRRGGAHASAAAGDDLAHAMPIGFFRWWFLAPLDGQLLIADVGATEERFVLRSGGAVVDLGAHIGRAGLALEALRHAPANEERIAWSGTFAPRAGDHGVYVESSGLRVTVRVESVANEAPPRESFLDPDGEGGVK